MTSSDLGIDCLLDHADFVRRLAARLAGPDQGEDLAQEALATAFSSPPRDPVRSPKAWLATVTRNLWRNERRSVTRRLAREGAVAANATTCSVAEIAAREEARQRVVAAVLDLPDRLREVVLLRYYEGLDSEQIATRVGLAASTVRTHLQAAMPRLRAKLDAEHDGNRAAWAAPLALWLRPASPAPAALSSNAPVYGLGAAALCLVGLYSVFWWANRDESAVGAMGGRSPVAMVPDSKPVADDARTEQIQRAAVAAAIRLTPAPASVAPSGIFRGLVHDGTSGRPVEGAKVTLRPRSYETVFFAVTAPSSVRERTLRTTAAGAFAVDALPCGAYEVFIEDGADRSCFAKVDHGPVPRLFRFSIEDSVGRGVSVRVIDPSGCAVEEARVCLALDSERRGKLGWGLRPPLRGITTTGGTWVPEAGSQFGGVREGVAFARGRDGGVGVTRVCRDGFAAQLGLRVTLHPPAAIVGRLTGLASYAGVALVAHWAQSVPRGVSFLQFAAEIAADGTYRIDGLPPGTYRLEVRGRAGQSDARKYWNKLPTVVKPGMVTAASPVAIDCAAGATVRGTVRNVGGEPVAGARVMARLPVVLRDREYLQHNQSEIPFYMHVMESATTDAAGRYELSLAPGSWHLIVAAAGYATDLRLALPVRGGADYSLEHRLTDSAAEVRGHAVSNFALRPVAQPELVQLVVTHGSFALPGLAPGIWEVGKLTRRNPAVFEAFDRIELRGGQTHWLDLVNGEERVHRGRLFHGGQPVSGYQVSVGDGGVPVTTAADGSFEVRHVYHRLDPQAPELAVRRGGFLVAWSEQLDGRIELDCMRLKVRATTVGGAPIAATLAIGSTFEAGFPKYAVYNSPGPLELREEGIDDLLLTYHEGLGIVATFPDGSRALQVLKAGQGEVHLNHRPTKAIQVLVTDAAGRPCADVRVQALAWGKSMVAPRDPQRFRAQCADPREIAEGVTDALGQASVRGVRFGSVCLSVFEPGRPGRTERVLVAQSGGRSSYRIVLTR